VAVPKKTIAVPKRKKIGAENAKIESAEKSAGGCFYTNANAFFLGCTKLG
jgi:hypothetical protein